MILALALVGRSVAAPEPAPEGEAPAGEEPAGEEPAGEQQGGEEVVIEGRRPTPDTTERTLDRAAVEAMPARSTDDLLRAMPGIHLSAHGGHGKAYQFFLRGFDAVHGADLAVDLEGVPINELSNVHAHGYLDLHFVPTALVPWVELHPGPWRPEAGDFAIAGSASMGLGVEERGLVAQAGVGSDASGEAQLSWRPEASAYGTFATADIELGRGVGMSRDWRQARAGVGLAGQLGTVPVRAWVLAYDGTFSSPGVLREDDLAAGEVGFYDAYPGSGGGHSSRVLGAVSAWGGAPELFGHLTAWAGYRALSLRQNFTGWYVDEVHGDGTLQEHAAASAGLSARGYWLPSTVVSVRAGVQARLDRLRQSEAAIDPTGAVWEERGGLAATQSEAGAWLAVPLRPTPWLAVDPSLRAEVFLIDAGTPAPAWAPVLAPKLSVRLFPDARGTLFARYGRGYRSPDARGAGDGGRAPVALADSVEVGTSAAPTGWLGARAAGFATLVTDEIVFDHVAARYVATGSTRRVGVDAGVSARPLPELRLDADLTWADARYVATGEPIPYAPRVLVVAGVYAERLPLGATVLTAGLRGVVLGPRPLPEGFTGHTAVTADLTSSLSLARWELTAEIDNVFGTRWRDGEFVFPSRWDPDAPRAELPVRHFTAGTPFAARLSLSRRF